VSHFTAADHTFLENLLNLLTVAMEKTRARQQLLHLAQHDSLTGLPNRSMLLDRLQLAVKTAQRQGTRLGLIYLDLDRFKQVNDTEGHPAGDLLLVQAALRMTACLRAGDTVARLSGDEFAILLPGLENTSDAELVGRKILTRLAEPFDLNGKSAYVTGSMGAAIYPDNGADPATLVRSADRAMYSAKEAGRNDFHYYNDDMNADETQRLEFGMLLRGALARDEFFLLYQPKVDLLDGQICGIEALLRWQHPERGVVGPTEFIPLLEETGMIVFVGEWVFNRVAKQIIQWQAEGVRVPRVSINLSPRQFTSPNLDAQVKAMLATTGVDPTLIEFEITESSLMRNPAMTTSLLERFRSYGLSLSIDDFGTGYSSLSYLKRFPLDTLKIDRTFIRDLSPESDDAAITWAIISLAHSLKLKVVAEGVETTEQLDMLRDRACDEIQGFYFSVPQSAFDCALMLRAEKRLHWETPANGNANNEGHWRTRQDANQADALVLSTQLSERPVEPPAAVPLTTDRYQSA
jgi:diguanylate cyclase (GGDEF)-like protein